MFKFLPFKVITMTNLEKFADRLKIEPIPRFSEVKVTYLGKPTNFEVLGYLHLPNGELATPNNLGKAAGVDSGFTANEAVKVLNIKSEREWKKEILLSPYTVEMHIAQNCPDIFDERVGSCAITNTVLQRCNEELGLDMPVIQDGKVKTFLDGKIDAKVEETKNLGRCDSFLDENMWPASKGTRVKERIDEWIGPFRDKANVYVVYTRFGSVAINAQYGKHLNELASALYFPLVKIR